MLGDLLNDRSLMFLALIEVMYLTADVSDNVRWVTMEERPEPRGTSTEHLGLVALPVESYW